jgi:hypothetical protein
MGEAGADVDQSCIGLFGDEGKEPLQEQAMAPGRES